MGSQKGHSLTTDAPEAVVIRYADHLTGRYVDTIAEHNNLFEERSDVYVGKFGKPVGQPFIRKCCDEKAQVSLILVKKAAGPGEYEAYIAPIIYAQRDRPRHGSFPAYYDSRIDISCWFRIAEPFTRMAREELSKWIVSSSGSSLLEALSLSMSGLFYIYRGEPRPPAPLRIRQKRGKARSRDYEWDFQDEVLDDLDFDTYGDIRARKFPPLLDDDFT